MKAELKRAADLVAFQRREALARKRLSGDPRNPFRPRYGAELTFTAAAQEAETLGYILKLLEKEAARECARRVIPTLDAILDFVIGFGLLALAMLGVAAACVAAGAPDSITRTAALLGVGFITASRCTAWGGSNSKNDYTGRRTAMKSNGKLCPLGKLVVKALADQEKTKSQLAAEIGTSPQYLSYILYGVRSGEKYLPALIAALKLDPRKVEKATAA